MLFRRNFFIKIYQKVNDVIYIYIDTHIKNEGSTKVFFYESSSIDVQQNRVGYMVSVGT